ncbi:putative porin [Pontimicrobium sp. SW4]|uniref:Porin n=1 Tax=Pontimicrobium sp. SW4 TaxID=3153519 RepID=A0AAU7BTQ5_9FLAO
MNRIVLLLFSFFMVGVLTAQVKPPIKQAEGAGRFSIQENDSLSRDNSKRIRKNENATIDLYKIISKEHDTTFVDTTLTIYKEYKFNYLRRDNFTVLPFSNIGQTYNTLSYDFENNSLIPVFGARARHFNFIEVEDVNYYYVPTPLTELMFKTAFEQGQLLDAFFTVNTTPQFNFSIAYKGLRSLGKYQHVLTSTGNFRFTTNYKTKNGRYNVRAHSVIQDLMNEENGGILDKDLKEFESGNPRFIDRSVFDPAFEDAESVLKGKRFHLDHYYNLIQQKDSSSQNTLSLGNLVSYESKYYQYEQTSPYTDYFGDSFPSSNLNDKTTLENVYVEANTRYRSNTLGELKFNLGYSQYNYGYNTLVSINGNDITNRLKGNVVSVGGGYKNTIRKLQIQGDFGLNLSGDFDGNFLNGRAGYSINEDSKVSATINISSKAPNYNYLLYQSDYINYNWQNSFDNIQTKQLGFDISSSKLINLNLDYTTINNYTYFNKTDTEPSLLKPNQYSGTVNYFRARLEKELKFGKFALNNTLLYQTVVDGADVLNVPDIITRNTFYYTNHFFEKALFLQTGITFNYFSKYNMNGYDPVLAEFYIQNEKQLGGYPRLDFFINAKVKQTRIFFKLEHFNAPFTGYNYYSTPNAIHRDLGIRFGLVWNFFM